MIRRSTWYALGVLTVAVLAAVLWSRTGGEQRSGQSDLPPTPSPLWTVESNAVEQLVIENGEGEVLLAAARDASAGWILRQPPAGPADAGRLERAVSWLASPPVREELEAPVDLTPFELDPPRYRVRVITRPGNEQAFAIGREAPTGDMVYAMMPGRPGIVLLSGFGVEEVLGLLEPLPLLVTAFPSGATGEP
jgi:hypothetical protein